MHHLSAAVGWAELGNPAEAEAELARIAPEHRSHPDVLDVRWMVCSAKDDWKGALITAQQLVDVAPERASAWLNRAYALRRVPDGGLQEAWDALLPAATLFPQEPIVPFNLACYACQMDRPKEAIKWLRHAARIGGKARIREMALCDEDLRPLWDEIRKM